MPFARVIASALLLLVFFVGSGAALYAHERTEHRAFESALEPAFEPAAAEASPIVATKTLAKSPHDRLPTHGIDNDCAVCFQLLHVAALVTLVLYLLTLVGRRLAFVIADPDSPVSATIFSPRSSRGPPLAPAC